MINKVNQEKNLFDFMNDIESQMAETHVSSTKVLKINKRTSLKFNSMNNKKVQELLQHIVKSEKSF